MMAFSTGTFGGPMISEGHCNVSPPEFTNFGTLGKSNTSDETGTSKKVGKAALGDRPNTPQSSISRCVEPAGLHVGQLKMDMPLVFSANGQQNMKGWLMKMERYFKLIRYPVDTWIDVVATRLTDSIGS